MKDLEIRNQIIYEAHCAGKSLQDLAMQYGLTPQRISQIISNFKPPISDDEARSLERAHLEYVGNTLLGIIADGPHPMVDVKGCIVYNIDGTPIQDHQQVIQAADAYRKVSAEKRRMDALDLPRRKQMVEDEAMKQAVAFIQNLDQRIAYGEVIPLESGEPTEGSA